jgi:predicted outer membrane repeat protein
LQAVTVVMLVAGAQAAELQVPSQYATIQAAISAAANGDVVVVSPGTYTGTINTQGKAITLRSTDPLDPVVVAATILDGEGTNRVLEVFNFERPDTVISGFTIINGDSDLGGGIAVYDADPTIRHCVFRANDAGLGGAAYLEVSSALFADCRFESNTANQGGAVYARYTTLARLERCELTANQASSAGGAIAADLATVRLLACLVAGNVAGTNGGAYAGFLAKPYVIGSLVRDNVADRGGAFYFYDDNAIIVNSTVVRNTALIEGGLITGIDSQSLVYNDIIRDNGANPIAGYGVSLVAEYSNIEGNLSGPGVIDADPLFVDPGADDFRLQAGSPSEDTGLNGRVPSYLQVELGGDLRILGDAVDMGAYERPGDAPEPPGANGRVVVSVKDDGSEANGYEQPLLLYDADTDTWSRLFRDLPAFAIASDPGNNCFWVQSGESGMLARLPYDTLILEEIGFLDYFGRQSATLSGLAVRQGELYATIPWSAGGTPVQPEGLYRIDTASAAVELVTAFPSEYEVWDLHYDEAGDRMLVLSNASYPGGPLGVFEYDFATGALTLVQQWFNNNPLSEASALQGLATGDGRTFIFRPLYNKLEVYDDQTMQQIAALTLPPALIDGNYWVLGGLTWLLDDRFFPVTPGDMNCDGAVDFNDISPFVNALTSTAGYANDNPHCHWRNGDMDGDGDVDYLDIDPFVQMMTNGA